MDSSMKNGSEDILNAALHFSHFFDCTKVKVPTPAAELHFAL